MKAPLSLALTLAMLAASCRRSVDSTASLARADAAATHFAGTLRTRLQSALREGGPVAAVAVCSTEAPALAARVRAETGVRVGRSSLRARNPANAAPPAWVTEWLRAQGERSAEGVTGIHEAAGGRVHVLRPLAVEPVCVMCHGAPDAIAPPLREALRARYPNDRATGYRPGDLRGALWAEAALRP